MRQGLATFNTGSSSLKFSLYEISQEKLGQCLVNASLVNLGASPRIQVSKLCAGDATRLEAAIIDLDHKPAVLVPALLDALGSMAPDLEIVAAGHRIVHGGPHHSGPCLADGPILAHLKTLSPFAPDHQPHNLAGVESLRHARPGLVQSLSFDTSFHRTIPRISQFYAVPRSLIDSDILRFGFHGLSYDHIAHEIPNLLPNKSHARVIAAHLGSGASLCAIRDGQSRATTMGLTALSGIPMATRSGDIDPGLILYLMKTRNLSHDEISDMLYHGSGLLGVSGVSEDVRMLERDNSLHSRQAIAHYVDRICREIGAMLTATEGIDALVFTGGVGENSSTIRAQICARLGYLGLNLDPEANAAGAPVISTPDSPVSAVIVKADEESVIARNTLQTWVVHA